MIDSLKFARVMSAVLFASAALAGCAVQPMDAPSPDSGDDAEAVAESQEALSDGMLVISNEYSSGCLTLNKAAKRVEDKICAWDANGHSTDKNQRLSLESVCYNLQCGQRLRFQGTPYCLAVGFKSAILCDNPFDGGSFQETVFSIAAGAKRDNFNALFMVKGVGTTQCMTQTFNASPFDTLKWGKCPAGPNLNNPNTTGFNWLAMAI
jgi:hypothetical protein